MNAIPQRLNQPESDHVQAFVDELSALCAKCGIGIEGGILYNMQCEDRPHSYAADADSRLYRV